MKVSRPDQKVSHSAVVMVGAFPPPVHGMAAVNSAVRRELGSVGANPAVINLAASSLDPSLRVKLGRIPRVVRGLLRFATLASSRKSLYINVSGGLGQFYELLFVCAARLSGMRVFLHHHCHSYLGAKRSSVALLLFRAAGKSAQHIVQSEGIAKRLRDLYGCVKVAPVSNAVFLVDRVASVAGRQHLATLGFISNVSAEKGVFHFLDLMDALRNRGLQVAGRIAGPFQDEATKVAVEARLRGVEDVSYVGAKYGVEKDAFFSGIDVLVFPTEYVNETEGLVNHEAMSRGIPVIAYGRGAIPEIVDASCGFVVDPSVGFVDAAMPVVERWFKDSGVFRVASANAPLRFKATLGRSSEQWRQLLSELVLG